MNNIDLDIIHMNNNRDFNTFHTTLGAQQIMMQKKNDGTQLQNTSERKRMVVTIKRENKNSVERCTTCAYVRSMRALNVPNNYIHL